MKKRKNCSCFGTLRLFIMGILTPIQRASVAWSRSCHRLVTKGIVVKKRITLRKRFQEVREAFKWWVDPVYKLDETELPQLSLGWEPLVTDNTPSSIKTDRRVDLCREKAYKEELEVQRVWSSLRRASFRDFWLPWSGKIPKQIGNTLPSPSVASSTKKSWSWGAPATGKRLLCRLSPLLRCTC